MVYITAHSKKVVTQLSDIEYSLTRKSHRELTLSPSPSSSSSAPCLFLPGVSVVDEGIASGSVFEDTKTVISLETFQHEFLQKEVTIALIKFKTLEYFLVRKIRERVRTYATQLAKSTCNDKIIPHWVKTYLNESYGLVFDPANVAKYRTLISQYSSLFEMCLL